MLSDKDLLIAENHLATLQGGGYFFLATQLYYGIHGKKYPACEVVDLKRYLSKIMVPDLWDARNYFYDIIDQMILVIKNKEEE
ncbi:MAG: hypothetical protein ACD_58C00217G0003 [uncultured bacterium]|nr:MAG: hypothetical protein ACD_58C00217G0003 [uncultured bacterium]